MKIAMFTNTYIPFVGGVPISIDRLAKGLRKLGHTVYIFAPNYNEEFIDDKYTIRVNTINHKYNFNNSEFVIPNVLTKDIEIAFNSLDIDIIHIHHPFLMGHVGMYLSKKYNKPLVYTYHTKFEEYLHNIKIYKSLYKYSDNNVSSRIVNFTKEKLIPIYLKSFCEKCDVVLSPTNSVNDYLKKIDSNINTNTVSTGIDEGFFKNDKIKVNEIKSKYKKDKKYLFCTVSRLTKEKNIEFLIKGLYQLKKQIGNNFRCLIIGNGPYYEKLKNLIDELNLQDNVELMGSIDNKELKNYYASCDMFLFASKSETQGIVLLEAMASKIPVIAIDSSGICDIIKNNTNGFKTTDDINDWVEKIKLTLDNKNLYKNLQIGAYNEALKYKQENISKKVQSIYIDCVYESKEKGDINESYNEAYKLNI